MIEKKTVYYYEDRFYESLEKALDAVEGDVHTFISDTNRLLSPASRLTPSQVIAITEGILTNQRVMLKLLNILEEARDDFVREL